MNLLGLFNFGFRIFQKVSPFFYTLRLPLFSGFARLSQSLLMSTKGLPFSFCKKMPFREFQRVPQFRFFNAMRQFRIPIFCLILSFLNRYPTMIFFSTIRIECWRWSFEFFVVYPNGWRHIWTTLRFNKEVENRNQCSHFSPLAMSKFLTK